MRVPVLRRWVNRWRVRRLRPGTEPIPVDQLISPHRSDILARKAVFDLAAEHRDILDTEEFFELASQSLYGVWFRKIVVPGLGLAGAPEQEQATLFRQAVSRATHLFASFEANGFNTQHPITVARVPAGTKVAGRSLAEDRWVPVDGNHRLALLVRSGQSHIETDQYVIDPDGDRRHNTATMRDALGQTESEAVAFLARGLCRPGSTVTTWAELLDDLELPANRAHLERWPEAELYSTEVRRSQPAHDGGWSRSPSSSATSSATAARIIAAASAGHGARRLALERLVGRHRHRVERQMGEDHLHRRPRVGEQLLALDHEDLLGVEGGTQPHQLLGVPAPGGVAEVAVVVLPGLVVGFGQASCLRRERRGVVEGLEPAGNLVAVVRPGPLDRVAEDEDQPGVRHVGRDPAGGFGVVGVVGTGLADDRPLPELAARCRSTSATGSSCWRNQSGPRAEVDVVVATALLDEAAQHQRVGVDVLVERGGAGPLRAHDEVARQLPRAGPQPVAGASYQVERSPVPRREQLPAPLTKRSIAATAGRGARPEYVGRGPGRGAARGRPTTPRRGRAARPRAW